MEHERRRPVARNDDGRNNIIVVALLLPSHDWSTSGALLSYASHGFGDDEGVVFVR